MKVVARAKLSEPFLAENHTLHEVYPHVEVNLSDVKIIIEEPLWLEQFQRGEVTIAAQLTPSGTIDLRIIPDQKDKFSPDDVERRLQEQEDRELKSKREARKEEADRLRKEREEDEKKKSEAKIESGSGEPSVLAGGAKLDMNLVDKSKAPDTSKTQPQANKDGGFILPTPKPDEKKS